MPLNIIPYDEHAAKIYGKIRAQLEKKGQVIGPLYERDPIQLMIDQKIKNLKAQQIELNLIRWENYIKYSPQSFGYFFLQ